MPIATFRAQFASAISIRRFVTAPLQLVQVEAPDAVDLAAEREKGHVAFGNRHYWVQHVVF